MDWNDVERLARDLHRGAARLMVLRSAEEA